MRAGARAALPLAVAVGIFGISFGVLARSSGFGAVAPVVMSATTFAGSAQFAAISIVRDGGGLAAAATAAVLLNARCSDWPPRHTVRRFLVPPSVRHKGEDVKY